MPLYSTAHQPFAQGWKETSTASRGTEATTGDWLDGAPRRCAAVVTFQVLAGSSCAIARDAVTTANATAAETLNTKGTCLRFFFTAGFPKGYNNGAGGMRRGMRPVGPFALKLGRWKLAFPYYIA